MGYGVIGSPTDSGSVSLGSSPGTPATGATRIGRLVSCVADLCGIMMPLVNSSAPSSSGLGRRPLKAVAPVRIRSGLLLLSVLKEECDRRVVRVAVRHVVKLLRYELTYFDRRPVDAGH